MIMASEDMRKVLREEIIKNDKDQVRKILNDHADIDLNMMSGDKENLINVAIENADVEMLALLLGIQGPPFDSANAISDSKRHLINSVSDSEGKTPLMKAVQHGKVDIVSLLLLSGAEVNYFSQRSKMAAIDFSTDPKILLELLKSDSKFPIDNEKSKELQKLISKDKGLSDFFKERDGKHELIKKGDTGAVKSFFTSFKMDQKQRMYFINSKGCSILYTAIENKAFDTWASLKSLGMYYATEEEKKEEKGNEEMCELALSKLLIPLKGCHLMKLLIKSDILNKRSESDILNGDGTELKTVSQYFDYLNDIETTKTLMEVLQDVEGLQIAFDLESTNIEKLRPCSSHGERGTTDFKLLKICAAAKRDKKHGIPEISSNLAHEMCHLAMHVVYGNYGLPYRNGDLEREREYKGVMYKIIRSTGCQKIISKVWEIYDSGLYGQELIVRVPEMKAFYKCSSPDFISHLNDQEEELVSYYENNVDPDLRKYIESNLTSGRIFCRSLLNYHQLLSPGEIIQVKEGIRNPIVGKHNCLQVLRASSVKLAQSHLKSFFEKEGKDHPYFCDWSLYTKIIRNTKEDGIYRNGIKECLNKGEIKMLVMTWDINEKPEFCGKTICTGRCPGSYFSEYTDCVYLLVSTKCSVMKKIKSNNYSWDDLHPRTKKMIQEKEVKFCGESVKLKTLISGLKGGDYFEEFMSGCFDSKDINLLLGEEAIQLGKTNSFTDFRSENTVLKHLEVPIVRKIIQNVVKFDKDMLRAFEEDVFFVSNVALEGLCNRGISGCDIRQWDVSTRNDPARCYILPPSLDVNEELAFQQVLDHLHGWPKGQVKTLHHLKFRKDLFAHIKSVSIQIETDLDKVKGLTCCTDGRHLGASDFEGSDPFLLAEEPGTGKTTFLHSLPEKIKVYHPEKWVSIVDLCLQSPQKYLETMERKKPTSEKETLDFLFLMVESGKNGSLERKIFDEFCKAKNNIIVIFDGFDEICPRYKSVATSFIVSLRKINIKLAVSTRLREKFHLEETLDVISLQLIPFTRDERKLFLNMYWNELFSRLSLPLRKEKMECSIERFKEFVNKKRDDAIGKLISVMEELLEKGESRKRCENEFNFTPVAERILSTLELLDIGLDKFTETPLHLQMVGALLFEDSFKMNQIMNVGHLYQRFFDLMIKIYMQEKAHSSGNVQSNEISWDLQELYSEKLEKLSANILEGKQSCELTDNEIRRLNNIGLVSQRGEDYQFIHRTFAEFFFARRMLRKAGKKKVTKLWLEKLFVDDQYARVRKFLEDILYLFSEESKTAGDFLMLKKATLNQSVLDDTSALINCIYCVVYECSLHSLQYFADSFGEKVARVLIQEFDINDCNESLKAIVSKIEPRPMKYVGDSKQNAFSFAWLCYSQRRSCSTNYVTLVKKMLGLVKEYKMCNKMKQHVLTNCVHWLPYLPPHYDMAPDYILMHAKEVLNIFLEFEEIFGDTLRGWMTLKCNWWSKDLCQSLFTLYFDILPLVMGCLYDETQLKSVLSEKGVVSNVWINTTGKYGLDGTVQVWNYIKKCLDSDVTHLRKYLEWKSKYGFNALTHSACNEDPKVIEFIWDIAGEIMDVDDKKQWLFDCFLIRGNCEPWEMNLGWSFHKFLARRLNFGFLSVDEMFRLLKPRKECGECHTLDGYPYGLFFHVLPIQHNLTLESFAEEMRSVELFYACTEWLMYRSSLPLNEDLKDKVDEIFRKVISLDTCGLTDQIKVDESGFLVGVGRWPRKIHQDRFKFFVAAFYKQVEFCRDHFKEDGLVNSLKVREEYTREEHNILHAVVCKLPPLIVGYVYIVLIKSLSRDNFLNLLFKRDGNGKTVFHMTFRLPYLRDESDFSAWKKLNDVVRAVLGQGAGSADPNEKLFRQNMPESREALEEHLARWKSILKRQREREQSEITLRQVTDVEVSDEMEGEEQRGED